MVRGGLVYPILGWVKLGKFLEPMSFIPLSIEGPS